MATGTIEVVEIRRVSTEEQAKDDHAGLARQSHNNRETARRIGASIIQPAFELTDVCRESFVSTPEWRGIRKLIQAPNVHIVVDDPDRFVADYGGIEILGECQRTGTLIYHPSGVLDPSTLDGQLVGVIRAVLAGNELKSIKRRVQGAKEAKRRDGIFPSAAIALPTGIAYERTKGQQHGRWVYNEDIDRVREVWRLVLDDGLTNWREVGTRTGFSGMTARNILRNPIYMGWWILDKRRESGPTPIRPDGRRKDRKKVARAPEDVIRKQVFRPHGGSEPTEDSREEAIVSESDWHRVQGILGEKRLHYHRVRDLHSSSRFVFGGCLWCAECGERIYSRTKPKHGRSKTRRDWYACRSCQLPGGTCSTKYLRLAVVNEGIDWLFSTLLSDEQFSLGLINAALSSGHVDQSAKIASTKAALKKLKEQRSKLLDLYLSGGWAQSELDARRVRLDGEIHKHEEELSRFEREQGVIDSGQQLECARRVLVTLREFEFWSVKQKRELLGRFFPKVYVSKRGVERVDVLLTSETPTAGNGETPGTLSITIGIPWTELRAPAKAGEFGIPEKDLYTRSDVAQVLGLSVFQFSSRVRNREIAGPSRTYRGRDAWSSNDIRAILKSRTEDEAAQRWGLPRKGAYTTGEITTAFGITWGQLRYALESGRLTVSVSRDANGHRIWREADLEAVASFFGVDPGKAG